MGLAITSCLMLASKDAEAGYFATITIDGLYADWAGVPVVNSDGGDNSGGPDIGDTQIAHDGQNLYIRNTFPNSLVLVTRRAPFAASGIPSALTMIFRHQFL